MMESLEDPNSWQTPPLLWIVIDDPGGRRVICHGSFWDA